MKVLFGLLVAALLFFHGSGVIAQPLVTVDGFAKILADARNNCAKQAQQATEKANTANFKASLDLKLAQQQAEMDAQVYGVGHGRRETREYLLDRMRGNSSASIATATRISDKLAADGELVKTCVAEARAQGKAAYSYFKADKRHKKDMPEAEALITAWLTNVAEISIDQPEGSAASLAAWNTAKAHAEVSAL